MPDSSRTKVYPNPVLPMVEVQALWLSSTGASPGPARLQRLLDNASLVLALYIDDRLVGVLRALSDFTSTCYVVDAVTADEHPTRELVTVLIRELGHYLDAGADLILAPHLRRLYATRPIAARGSSVKGETLTYPKVDRVAFSV